MCVCERERERTAICSLDFVELKMLLKSVCLCVFVLCVWMCASIHCLYVGYVGLGWVRLFLKLMF